MPYSRKEIAVKVFVVVRTYSWYAGPDHESPYGQVVSVHMSRKKANTEVKRLDSGSGYREEDDGEKTFDYWHEVVKMTVVP